MATPPPPPPPTSSVDNGRSHVTASSPSPASSVPQNTNTSMDQVWKDIIKFAPLSDGSSSSSASNTRSSTRDVLLHDFIPTKHSSAVLFSCNPNPNPFPISSSAAESAQPITLSLFNHPNNSLLSSFDISKSSTVACPSNGNKKVEQDVCALSDPRHQRMIKNRESAVRSRARKQAYRNALELKVARLTEENSRLRQQVEEMKLRLTSTAKNPKKRTLYSHRTSTSPF